MCSPEQPRGPSPSALWANLRQPGPLDWKARRFVANWAIKISQRQACCGHPGEPGC